ncbi:24366_t:CDS:2, partial [Gigaspora rosea]
MEFAISFEHTEEFASIEFHNEDLVNIVNELAVELSIGSWNEFDHFEL